MPVNPESDIHHLLCNWINNLDLNSLNRMDLLVEVDDEVEPSQWLVNQLETLFEAKKIKPVVKVISAFGNVVIKIEVAGSAYCLILEKLASSPDYHDLKGLDETINNNPKIKQFIPAPYASHEFNTQNESEHVRLKLMPFYSRGTLMSQVYIGAHLAEGQDDHNLLEIYKKIYLLKSVYNPFCGIMTFMPIDFNDARKFDQFDLAYCTKKGVATLQTLQIALKRLAKIFSITEDKPIQDAVRHIQFYFEELLVNLRKAGHILSDEIIADIRLSIKHQPEERSEIYGWRIIETIQKLHEPFENAIKENAGQQALLNQLIQKQQKVVWKWVGQILALFEIFEKEGIQYYDIKPENLLINENDELVLVDRKSCARLCKREVEGEKIEVFSAGTHVTYSPPEFDQLCQSTYWEPAQARAVTLYQLGALFYNMTIGLPSTNLGHGAHEFYEGLIKAGLTCKFDFHLANFETPIGQALKKIVLMLTTEQPYQRTCLKDIKEYYAIRTAEFAFVDENPSIIIAENNHNYNKLIQIYDKPIEFVKEQGSAKNIAIEPEKSVAEEKGNHKEKTIVKIEKNEKPLQPKRQVSGCVPEMPTCGFFKQKNNVTASQSLLLGLAVAGVIVGGVTTGFIVPSIAVALMLIVMGGLEIGASRVYMNCPSPK